MPHITVRVNHTILKSLYWLPVRERIVCKCLGWSLSCMLTKLRDTHWQFMATYCCFICYTWLPLVECCRKWTKIVHIRHVVSASGTVECVSSLCNIPWGVSKMIEINGANFLHYQKTTLDDHLPSTKKFSAHKIWKLTVTFESASRISNVHQGSW